MIEDSDYCFIWIHWYKINTKWLYSSEKNSFAWKSVFFFHLLCFGNHTILHIIILIIIITSHNNVIITITCILPWKINAAPFLCFCALHLGGGAIITSLTTVQPWGTLFCTFYILLCNYIYDNTCMCVFLILDIVLLY